MEKLELYAVNYVDNETLQDHESIRTHSESKAICFAEMLRKRDEVLYSQVVTYEYNLNRRFYQFKKLKNYYK